MRLVAITPSGHPVELKSSTPTGIKRNEKQNKTYEKAIEEHGLYVTYKKEELKK